MRFGGNIVAVKNHNRQALLQCLLDRPYSRVELAGAVGISSMTVTNLVRDLLAEGWVEAVATSAENNRPIGRPRKQLQLRSAAGYAIGIHIGIGTFRVALVDLTGVLIAARDAQFVLGEPASDTIAQFAALASDLLAEHGDVRGKLLGIGVGASGLVDSERGVNVIAPSLNWHNVPLASLLQTQLAAPVFVENNVRAMALAEAYFGQARTVDSLAFVFGRIGVGAGFIMQRQLFRGIAAGAGEIGHTIIMPENGRRCRCGQRGCLETLVTEPVLLGEAYGRVSVEQFLDEGRGGSAEVLTRIDQLCTYLGIALTNLVNTLNPEQIILGGLYAQGSDLFLPRLQTIIQQRAFGGLGKQVTLTTTSFNQNAGVIGAATLALVNNFYAKPLR
ncbi:MAG: ROK family protein [Candidatus Promineifilaceae bacterium]